MRRAECTFASRRDCSFASGGTLCPALKRAIDAGATTHDRSCARPRENEKARPKPRFPCC